MNKQLRILHIFMGMGRSGVPILLMNYYRHIDRSKIQFDFAVESKQENYFTKEIESLGGRVHRLAASGNSIMYYIRLSRVLRENKYDAVHAHMNYRNMPLLLFARLHGIRNRVSHSHNTYTLSGFFKKIFRKTLVFMLNRNTTICMACSEFAGRSLYGDRQVDSGRVLVLNNAIELEKFNYNPDKRNDVRKSMELDDKIVIGHVGNFLPAKNHLFLLDTFCKLKSMQSDAVLLLAGRGSLMKEVKKKVLDSGLEDAVIFLGSRDDLEDIYQAFDFFLFPSLNEGLAIVLIEAQASGLPCLVPDNLTDEACCTELVEKMALEEGAIKWAEKVSRMLCTDYSRKGRTAELRQCGFDIRREALKLEIIYLEMKGKDGKR